MICYIIYHIILHYPGGGGVVIYRVIYCVIYRGGVVIYPSLSRRHPLSPTIWPWALLSHNLWIHFHGFMDDFNAILVLKPPRLKNFSPTKL